MTPPDLDRPHLIYGDCYGVVADLLALRPAVLTDPPYGIGLASHDRTGKFRRRGTTIRGDQFHSVGLHVILAARRLNLTVGVFASPWKPWAGTWRNLIAWDKGPGVGGGGDTGTCLKRSWELIQVHNAGPLQAGRQESVWTFPVGPAKDHPAEKPVALCERLVTCFTSPGDLVVDPFMGSGSMAVACARLGRRFVGVEIEPAYYRLAVANLARDGWHSPVLSEAPEPVTVGG